jgi:hypothetical protein
MDQENARRRPLRLVARTDNKKMYLALVIAVLALGSASFLASRFEIAVLASGVVIGIVVGVRETLRGNTRVVIDELGILDNRLGLGTIRWRDLRSVYVTRRYNIAHVCLEVENSSQYLRRRSVITNLLLKYRERQTDIPPFSINTGVLDIGAGEIYEAIISNWEFYSKK